MKALIVALMLVFVANVGYAHDDAPKKGTNAAVKKARAKKT